MHADCLPHASVSIKVNHEALTEYNTENTSADNATTATTFVEATPGANFTVHLQLGTAFAYRGRGDCITFRVYGDGEYVGGVVVETSLMPTKAYVDGLVEVRAGVSTLRKLSFAEHTSTDSHVQPSLLTELAKLGEIKVELFRGRRKGDTSGPSGGVKGLDKTAIPEKALKGRSISNHTELGPAEVVPPMRYANVTYPYGKGPIATYIFQYRSRKDLEIEGIVERPRSPVPLTERDPDELTPDELREQNRLLRAQQASAANIKQEFKREKRARERSITLSDGNNDGDDSDEGEVTITGESDRRQKRARISAGAVDTVDLTED